MRLVQVESKGTERLEARVQELTCCDSAERRNLSDCLE